MRWQRRKHRRSRPAGLGPPERTARHTAVSYRTKYVKPGPNASLSRLMRLVRMERIAGMV
jgi:hypothetical protein